MNKVVVSFMAVKSARFVLVMLDRNGLLSTAPKKSIPITVVRQSIDPAKTSAKLGTALTLNVGPSPLPSRLFPMTLSGFKN